MNDLPVRLRALATLLNEKTGELEGRRWSASVAAFNRALTRFEETAEDAIRSLEPGLRELSRLLESPEKKMLDVEVMKKLFKDVLAMHAPKDLPAARQRAVFLAAVKEQGCAKRALAAVLGAIAARKAPKEKPSRDADKLRLELHRLGTLDDAQREYELAQRFSDKSDLRRLADAAGLPIPKEARKSMLISAILAAAKRVAGHTLAP